MGQNIHIEIFLTKYFLKELSLLFGASFEYIIKNVTGGHYDILRYYSIDENEII